MKSSLKKSILALACLTVMSGCASMYGDNTRQVKVDSIPQGADIYIDGARVGSTPTVVNLSSYIYGGKTLVVKKKNYEESSILINAKFQPVTIWNLLNGFGFIIDAATGDILKVDPASLSVSAELNPVSQKSVSN